MLTRVAAVPLALLDLPRRTGPASPPCGWRVARRADGLRPPVPSAPFAAPGLGAAVARPRRRAAPWPHRRGVTGLALLLAGGAAGALALALLATGAGSRLDPEAAAVLLGDALGLATVAGQPPSSARRRSPRRGRPGRRPRPRGPRCEIARTRTPTSLGPVDGMPVDAALRRQPSQRAASASADLAGSGPRRRPQLLYVDPPGHAAEVLGDLLTPTTSPSSCRAWRRRRRLRPVPRKAGAALRRAAAAGSTVRGRRRRSRGSATTAPPSTSSSTTTRVAGAHAPRALRRRAWRRRGGADDHPHRRRAQLRLGRRRAGPAATASPSTPLATAAGAKRAVYSVLTNCTYDGMCYNAADAQQRLAKSVDRVHFDEAWYGYARFNPMYPDRYAMRGEPTAHPKDGPTVFATHSTHKLLAALSQTSYIHIRDGRGAIDHGRFNEAYCAQASTSPLYALIASNDVAAAMMDGPAGQALTQETIDEAVACRLALARARQEFHAKKDWFFAPWNAEEVRDPTTGRRIPFHEAPEELLAADPNCWMLHPARAGTASKVCRTAGACSTRSRSASSARA